MTDLATLYVTVPVTVQEDVMYLRTFLAEANDNQGTSYELNVAGAYLVVDVQRPEKDQRTLLISMRDLFQSLHLALNDSEREE